MTKVLLEELSKLREELIKNKQKETTLKVSTRQLSVIILGLKMSNAFDDILDEEIQIKHNCKKDEK